MSPLFPALVPHSDRPALRFGEDHLSYGQLHAAAAGLADDLAGADRVAVWATPTASCAVAVVAALTAGVPAVPLNPASGDAELRHILADSSPSLVLAAPTDVLPPASAQLPRLDVAPGPAATDRPASGTTTAATSAAADTADTTDAAPEHPAEDPALIVYTSGTTGPPKGAVLSRRAVAATLDSLAEAWQWTEEDVLVHALPLFHVHGLILGVLGPLRRGGQVRHLGRFSTEGVARELGAGATVLFGVPTMYHRIAQALAAEPALVEGLRRARLLVSGSAALPVHDHRRIEAATGARIVERYGMTETLITTSVRVDGPARPGTVGVPLTGVELRLADDSGAELPPGDPDAVGEIQVRGPSLFSAYLNRPEATAAAFTADGFFRTGDMAVLEKDGGVRIVGRKATDLIKSGGYKIGAGEIENALLDHPSVREVAVTGEPDEDLGERVVAWVVPADPAEPPQLAELAGHVGARLAPHKRPRVLRILDALPRNDMGKVLKRSLRP